jgi:hypothetical protein
MLQPSAKELNDYVVEKYFDLQIWHGRHTIIALEWGTEVCEVTHDNNFAPFSSIWSCSCFLSWAYAYYTKLIELLGAKLIFYFTFLPQIMLNSY